MRCGLLTCPFPLLPRHHRSKLKRLQSVAPLADCSLLKTLNLNDCENVLGPSLSRLTSLTALSLQACYSIHQDLRPLSVLTAMKNLVLKYASRISEVSPLSTLTALEMLDLTGSKVQSLSPLAACLGLRKLILNGSENLTNLPDFSSVERLSVDSCPMVRRTIKSTSSTATLKP